MIKYKDDFNRTAITSRSNLDVAYLKVLSLHGGKQVAVFLELRRVQRILPAYETFPAVEQSSLGPKDRSDFRYMPIKHLMGKDVPLSLDNDELVVSFN